MHIIYFNWNIENINNMPNKIANCSNKPNRQIKKKKEKYAKICKINFHIFNRGTLKLIYMLPALNTTKQN